MALRQSSIGKHALLTLTKNLLVLRCSECLPIIIFHIFTNSEVSVIKRRKDIPSEIKCNQKVAERLTFDLLSQRSLCAFLSPFIFWKWRKKPKYCRNLRAITLEKCFICESKLAWPSTNWPVSPCKYSCCGIIQVPLCCTPKQTELRNNLNTS